MCLAVICFLKPFFLAVTRKDTVKLGQVSCRAVGVCSLEVSSSVTAWGWCQVPCIQWPNLPLGVSSCRMLDAAALCPLCPGLWNPWCFCSRGCRDLCNFLSCLYFLSDYSNARLPVLGTDSLFYPKPNATLMQNRLPVCLGPAREEPAWEGTCRVLPAVWFLVPESASDCANDHHPRPTVGKRTLHKQCRVWAGTGAAQPVFSEPAQQKGALPPSDLVTSLVAIFWAAQ